MDILNYIHQKIIESIYNDISASYLAKAAGISRKTLYNYINKKKATLDTLEKICNVPEINNKLNYHE